MKEIKSEWFPHDWFSRSDPKIEILIAKYGMEGYGFYWAFIEQLYKNNGSINKADIQYVATSFNIKEEKLNEVITSGLFVIDGDSITSNRVIMEIEKRKTIKKVKTDAINKRWNK